MADLIIRCPTCNANNRISRERSRAATPLCGRCKAPLPVHFQPQEVTDASFAATVERSPVPVLVDFWAAWCGPCRMIAPVLDQLAEEFAGRVDFAKLNIDDNPQTASRFRVDSIPTLLVFRGGREIDRLVGVMPAPEIRRRLEAIAK